VAESHRQHRNGGARDDLSEAARERQQLSVAVPSAPRLHCPYELCAALEGAYVLEDRATNPVFLVSEPNAMWRPSAWGHELAVTRTCRWAEPQTSGGRRSASFSASTVGASSQLAKGAPPTASVQAHAKASSNASPPR
jgi:hypothetical protein